MGFSPLPRRSRIWTPSCTAADPLHSAPLLLAAAILVTLLFLSTLLCLIMGFIDPVVTVSALLTPVWAMSFLCL